MDSHCRKPSPGRNRNRHDVLKPGDAETVAAHAVRVNVFHTIDFLLKYSAPIREKVKNGQLEIQGVERSGRCFTLHGDGLHLAIFQGTYWDYKPWPWLHNKTWDTVQLAKEEIVGLHSNGQPYNSPCQDERNPSNSKGLKGNVDLTSKQSPHVETAKEKMHQVLVPFQVESIIWIPAT